MDLDIIPNSPIPAYKQLFDKVSSQILSGKIAGGSPLPPIRTVSKELGISVITVRSAWDMLLNEGYIESRAGSGCFAADLSEREKSLRRQAIIKEPVKKAVDKAESLGFSKDDLIKMIRET
ncbi:MAG: GntR family transcriptional regulator [Clostridiales bacterium]|nr:GntR family transcriptional regulator [Clostridiales bacterium]